MARNSGFPRVTTRHQMFFSRLQALTRDSDLFSRPINNTHQPFRDQNEINDLLSIRQNTSPIVISQGTWQHLNILPAIGLFSWSMLVPSHISGLINVFLSRSPFFGIKIFVKSKSVPSHFKNGIAGNENTRLWCQRTFNFHYSCDPHLL